MLVCNDHPERKPGEIWLGNSKTLSTFGAKSARFGQVPIPFTTRSGLRPVFADAKEILDKFTCLADDPNTTAMFAKDIADLRTFIKEKDGIDL